MSNKTLAAGGPSSLLILGESSAAYRNGAYFAYALERPKRVRISYGSPGFYSKWGLAGRAFNIFDLGLKLLGCDRVLVLPMCQMQPYVRLAVRFAGWLRKPIWLDAYISFYETQVHDRKLHQPGSAEAQALLVAERAIISGCERLIFLNRAESDYYLGIWDIKIPPEKISYVPLAAPFRPQARLPNLGQNSRLTFAWWGRLGNPLHGLDVLLEAFALLPGRNFRLVVAADGSPRDLEDLRSRVLALGLSEVVELRSDLNFNNGTLLSFLVTETDVALGVFGATAKARTVNVNKVVDALSLGLPCLTRNSAALQTMPDVDKFLHLWAGDCIKELAASIQFGLDHSELWRDKSKMASAAFLKYFSPVAFDRACDDLLGTFSRD